VPSNFLEHYDATEQQLILTHELAHAKRLNLWFLFLAELIRAVYWFYPLVDLAWPEFQQDQELACDHHLLKQADSVTRHVYGQAITKGLNAFITPATLILLTTNTRGLSCHHSSKTVCFYPCRPAGYHRQCWLTLSQTQLSLDEKTSAENDHLVSYELNDTPLMPSTMLLQDASPEINHMQNM
jgi:hypothetical protein